MGDPAERPEDVPEWAMQDSCGCWIWIEREYGETMCYVGGYPFPCAHPEHHGVPVDEWPRA